MGEKKKDERSNKILLSDDQIKFFYRIVVYCESEDINFSEFRIDYKSLKAYFSHKGKEDKIRLVSPSKENPIDFTEAPKLNEFKLLLTKGKGKGKSFLIHLRNCFAHNRIKTLDNDILEFMDMKGKKNPKITMVGKIEFKKLKDAVNAILVEAYKR